MISWPFGLYDCAAQTDGAAAAVVMRADLARQRRDDAVFVKGVTIKSGPNPQKDPSNDFLSWKPTGWAAEEATLSRDEGFQAGRSEAMQKVERKLNSFLPGDSSQLVDFSTVFSEENTDLVLLPIYVFAARYGAGERLRILVNGQTGEVQGKVPTSAVKVAVAVLIGIVVVASIVLGLMGASA